MTREQANSILPSEPTQGVVDPNTLVFLLIAERKWGKTAFFMSNPDAVLLAFESGHKFQKGFKVEIDQWDSKKGQTYKIKQDKDNVPHMTAMQALELLEKSKRYGFVIIDTVDMAVQMCTDFHTERARVEDPGDMGDFGKGWNIAVNKPMRRFILRILKTGRGVGLITHSKVEVNRFTSGEKARKECSLGGGVLKFVTAAADIMAHGEFGKKRAGQRLRDRILVCEGDMDILAGNRTEAMLPERYIVKRGQQWPQFKRFFTDPAAADKAEAFYDKSMRSSKK